MLKLQFVDGSRDSLWLVDAVFKIGRDRSNNLVIDKPDIQPFHAEILLKDDELVLRNPHVDNVVGVNNKRVAQAVRLQVNDTIQLGQTALRIIHPSTEAKEKAAAREATAEWGLEIQASWSSQSLFPIRGNAVIGRDESCDIVVPVSHLSRQHARLTPAGGFLLVKDLDSTNGTFLNGERITNGRARPGDKLRFDVVTFTVVGPHDDSNKTVVRPGAAVAPSGTATESAPSSASGAPVVKASQRKAAPASAADTGARTASGGTTAPPRSPTPRTSAPRTSGTGSAAGTRASSATNDTPGTNRGKPWIILAGVVVLGGIALLSWLML